MLYSLDIETAPKIQTNDPVALEPYKVSRGICDITSVAIADEMGEMQVHERMQGWKSTLLGYLKGMQGHEVYCHNTIFDLAFMIASLQKEFPNEDIISIIRNIKWRDTAILNKYLINGQKAVKLKVSYKLMECVRRALKDHPDYEEFMNLKEEDNKPGVNWDYWLLRGRLDARMTRALAVKLLTYLKPEMEPGYLMASAAISPLARGWLKGILVDTEEVERYESKAIARQKVIVSEIGVPGEIMTSAPRLGTLLFNQWGYEPVGKTPKGKPSTSAENMIRLHQRYSDDPRIRKIMEYRKIATMRSKYIDGYKRAIDYLGEPVLHGSPRVLATITGRMSYNSKILDTYQTSIAQHQIPRKDKGIKRCMKAPPGYKILYLDVSAQEGRFMAMLGPEPRMIRSYCNGIDLHSDLTEEIFGTPYADIVKANHDGEPLAIVEQRQAGKLTGLSSFYRIGGPALARKFFSTYEYDISVDTAYSYLRSFKRKYPGVPAYWTRSIRAAKEKGYAEAIGGWRFRIDDFGWEGESSAINHPIQGSGAIQTYATIGIIDRKWPDLILLVQVHDALIYLIPEEKCLEVARDLRATMNKFDYGKLLGFEQTVPIIIEVQIGDNFADLKDITTIKD